MERRCVNCSYLVPRNARLYLLQNESQVVIDLVSSWISPTPLTNTTVLCNECHIIIHQPRLPLPAPLYGHRSVCFGCGSSILRAPRTYRVHPDSLVRTIIERRIPRHLVSRLDRVCAVCWTSANRELQRQQQHDMNRLLHHVINEDAAVPDPPELPPEIQLPEPRTVPKITSVKYKRTSNTSNHCIYNDCQRPERLLVPVLIREMLLLHYQIYVTPSSRICHHHLHRGSWSELNPVHRDFTGLQMDNMMDMMNRAVNRVFDFNDIENMTPALCNYWLGMNAGQFTDLLSCVPHLSEQVPDAKLALCMYLVKLRTADSNERLATLFNKPRSTLEKYMTIARHNLTDDFVTQYLGFDHMTVQDVAARNKIIPEGLYGNPELPSNIKPAIVLCDATYIFVQNSTNYRFQKQTYSLQKLKNLVKPFMIVCCDGYIIDCLGPYKATTNDATITLNDLRNDDSRLRSFFRDGDVFILDRGFRDAMQNLEAHGFRSHMPETILENEHQLTTLQANRSRCVTLCRWVVEVVNGRVKRDYRLFRFVFNNRAATHLMADFRIACALLNKFHIPVDDPPEALEYVAIARNRLHLPNHLADFVESVSMNRRSANFLTITDQHPHLNTFPELTIDDLKRLALGTYQIKQARSYYGEHVRQTGSFSVEVNNEIDDDIPLILGQNNYLLRGRIKSRLISSRIYYTYILINRNQQVANTIQSISGYCCSCRVGKRTVGCCAHVMAITWYLSWARHNDCSAPASFLNDFFEEYDE